MNKKIKEFEKQIKLDNNIKIQDNLNVSTKNFDKVIIEENNKKNEEEKQYNPDEQK